MPTDGRGDWMGATWRPILRPSAYGRGPEAAERGEQLNGRAGLKPPVPVSGDVAKRTQTVFIRARAAARPPVRVRAQYARRYSPNEKPR